MHVLDLARLKRQRNRRKLTQRELAFLVKTSHTTIHLLETGGTKTLTEPLARAIVDRLDLPGSTCSSPARPDAYPTVKRTACRWSSVGMTARKVDSFSALFSRTRR